MCIPVSMHSSVSIHLGVDACYPRMSVSVICVVMHAGVLCLCLLKVCLSVHRCEGVSEQMLWCELTDAHVCPRVSQL